MVALAGGALACTLASPAFADGSAERIHVESGVAVSSSLVAIGRVLVGTPAMMHPGDSRAEVLVSRDGARWHPVTLPGAPAQVVLGPVDRIGNRLTISARGAVGDREINEGPGVTPIPGPLFVWASRDGTHWTGGQLVASSPQASPPYVMAMSGARLTVVNGTDGRFAIFTSTGYRPWVQGSVAGVSVPDPNQTPTLFGVRRDGRSLVAHLTPFGNGESQIRSIDGGRTWQPEPCQPRRLCEVRGWRRAPGLLVTDTQSSVDGGRHWAPIHIEASVRRGSRFRPTIDSVSRVAGGWLASANLSPTRSSDTNEVLLRSADGRTWKRPLRTPRCDDRHGASYAFSGPVRVGGRLYVSYDCFKPSGSPRDTNRLYESDATGVHWAPRPGIPTHLPTSGPMVAFRGRLVVTAGRGKNPNRLTDLVAIS